MVSANQLQQSDLGQSRLVMNSFEMIETARSLSTRMIIRNAGDYKFSGYIIKSVLSEEAMIMSQRTTKVGHLPNRTCRNKQF